MAKPNIDVSENGNLINLDQCKCKYFISGKDVEACTFWIGGKIIENVQLEYSHARLSRASRNEVQSVLAELAPLK
jgi:predicted secreted protein